jgi:ATP-dependent RNA circularization protein (DNA/RNA ligase family)
MEQTYYKYRKTMHLPFSLGLQNDDRRLEDEHCFDGKNVAVTVKMDGENTSMYRTGIHARSLYAMSHPSQHYIKGYWAGIKHLIPEGWRICGENMYARHSIVYEELESFFYVFSIWDENNMCLPLQQTLELCKEWNLMHVYIDGGFKNFDCSKHMSMVEEVYKNIVNAGHEGIVIRNAGSYHYDDFQTNVAKAVREHHVKTDEHWTKTWVPNKLGGTQ